MTTNSLSIYDFSVSVNAKYLKQIVPLLAQHNVAANPINYALWYDYVAGQNTALNEAIDSIIADHGYFGRDVCVGLYRTHVCPDASESFENINQQLNAVIKIASDSISQTRQQAVASNDNFKRKSESLETVSTSEDVRHVLEEIIQETQTLSETTAAMQVKLNQANVELEQLRQELAQTRKLSYTDGLTGLLNRRAFDDKLAELIGQPAGETYLAMLDIDHFKRVNDTYGHAIGDNVIKFVASLMTKHAEAHHHVARYGGEELGIIMPNTSGKQAVDIAETIRKTMEASRLKRKENSQLLDRITLSIGIAKMEQGDDAETLLVRADRALYQAKESGRNRVVHANF